MSNVFVVPRHNIGGGLVLFWPTDMNVDIQSFSNWHIDAIIDHGVDDTQQFTSFYGDPDTTSQENSQSLLKMLSSQFQLPWVCLGDFNEILLVEEKQGWLDRPKRQMQSFHDHYKKYCYLRRNFFDNYKKPSKKLAFSTASLFRRQLLVKY